MKELIELLKTSSKNNVLALCEMMEQDPEVFKIIMNIALSDEQPQSKRAVWALDTFYDRNPEIFKPYWNTIIIKLPEFKEERNQGSFLRMFSRVKFDTYNDENNYGLLFDFCITVIKSDKVQMFMKHYSLLVLENLGMHFSDLYPEIKAVIEENMSLFDREHLKKMGRRIINKLKSNISE
ncbi:MAG: hypothetical protein Kow0068_25940 [Marinilabiliales bacterium]